MVSVSTQVQYSPNGRLANEICASGIQKSPDLIFVREKEPTAFDQLTNLDRVLEVRPAVPSAGTFLEFIDLFVYGL
jgi:hypothetical protein